MVSAAYLPHPLLRSCIQAYVYFKPDAAESTATFDIYPVGYSMMVFSLNEHACFRDMHSGLFYPYRFHFVGQLTSHRRMKITHPEELCVAFTPTGAFRLLGLDQSELTGDSFGLRDLLQTGQGDLLRQIEDAGRNIPVIIGLLDNWFLKQWQRNDKLYTKRVEAACQHILNSSGTIPIRRLNTETGMSKSSLEAHFKNKTGLSPKMYSRIIRFNEAYRQISDCHINDWQELISRYHYFDQSHFIHEFKTFYGYTPSQVHAASRNLSAIIQGQVALC